MRVGKVLKNSKPTREIVSESSFQRLFTILGCFEKFYGNMRMHYKNHHWVTNCH